MDFNSLKPKDVVDLRHQSVKHLIAGRKKEEEETQTDCGHLGSLALCTISRNNKPFGHIESFTCFFCGSCLSLWIFVSRLFSPSIHTFETFSTLRLFAQTAA